MMPKRPKRPKLFLVTDDIAASHHPSALAKTVRRRSSILTPHLYRFIFFAVRCIRTRARNMASDPQFASSTGVSPACIANSSARVRAISESDGRGSDGSDPSGLRKNSRPGRKDGPQGLKRLCENPPETAERYFQPSLYGTGLPLVYPTQHCVLGYSQTSLRD